MEKIEGVSVYDRLDSNSSKEDWQEMSLELVKLIDKMIDHGVRHDDFVGMNVIWDDSRKDKMVLIDMESAGYNADQERYSNSPFTLANDRALYMQKFFNDKVNSHNQKRTPEINLAPDFVIEKSNDKTSFPELHAAKDGKLSKEACYQMLCLRSGL